METPKVEAASESRGTSRRLAELRKDLVVSVVERGGARIAVIKDPIAHRFYELAAEDYELARCLDPRLESGQQIVALRKNQPELCGQLDDSALWRHLLRISAELRACGLATGTVNGEMVRKLSNLSVLLHWLRRISGILFLRVRLFDPTPLLNATHGGFAFCFTRTFLLGSSLLGILTIIAFWRGGAFSTFDANWFISLENLAALYVGIVVLKSLHEAAHAVAVRHYGGNVHEVGMMLIAGLPLFYVDASDSYLFPKKSQRLSVSAAGIVVELVASIFLVWLWLILADGFARQLVLNLILIASVSTIFFNGNPLMRYDGYYILADALDMPSLRQRSREFVAGMVENWVLGIQPDPETSPSRREAWIYGLYGLLSNVYLIVVVFSVWKFVTTLLDPYGLKWVAHFLIGSWVLGTLVIPVLIFFAQLAGKVVTSTSSRRRGMILFFGLIVMLAGILFVPVPHWVERSCTLQPAGAAVIRSPENAFVFRVLVREGESIAKGQALAETRNRGLSSDAAIAKIRLEQLDSQLHSSLAQSSAANVGEVRNAQSAAQSQWSSLQHRLDSLTLRSPAEGVVASQNLARMMGAHLKPGEVFCVVRPPVLDEFLIPLNEKEARLIQKGARVQLRVRAYSHRAYRGEVIADPLRLKSTELPETLKASAGGEVATSATDDTPLTETHYALVRIINADESLKINMTGRVRIQCGSRTIGQALIEETLDFLRLDFRMR